MPDTPFIDMKTARRVTVITCVLTFSLFILQAAAGGQRPPGSYRVSWLGNSFSGASNRWVQNFFIHTKVQPDGTVNTWSHWDEGGKKFGVYKDGDVIGNTNVNPNSLEVTDKAGHRWKIEFDYVETKFHEYDFQAEGHHLRWRAGEVPRPVRADGAGVGQRWPTHGGRFADQSPPAGAVLRHHRSASSRSSRAPLAITAASPAASRARSRRRSSGASGASAWTPRGTSTSP